MPSNHTPLCFDSALRNCIGDYEGHPLVQFPGMGYCGIVEVRSLEEALGATCGCSADSQCSDCGTLLCSAHTERCQLCGGNFCRSCLTFHQSEHPNQKNNVFRPTL